MKAFYPTDYLPDFPRTPHLSFGTNLDSGDLALTTKEEQEKLYAKDILVNIEEKIDGASVGMTIVDGHPLIRNRSNVLNKGYFKATAAKAQFRPIWNYWYENKEKFDNLASLGPYSIYGEWMIAQHGINYTQLPSWFIAYDIYDYEKNKFIASPLARTMLTELLFDVPRLLFRGNLSDTYQTRESAQKAFREFLNLNCSFAPQTKVEGIYLKTYGTEFITNRFKLVRPDFARGSLWSPKQVNKNSLITQKEIV